MPVPIPFINDHPFAHDVLSRGRILYTDLDGTLLGRGGSVLVDGDGGFSTTTASAIVRVNEAELPIVLCSGRNRIQLAEIARLLGWSGFIAELGCVIVADRGADPSYVTGEWPDDALRPGETPFEAIARVGALDVLRETFPGKIEDHAPHHFNREATYVLRGNVDISLAREELAALDLPVQLVDNGIIHPPRTTLIDVVEVHAYHLVPTGVSKSETVAQDLARRGIARADALAIGDSATDVEMADTVGLLTLVGNALDDPRVLEAAAGRPNVATVPGLRGDGWTQLADAWLEARKIRA